LFIGFFGFLELQKGDFGGVKYTTTYTSVANPKPKTKKEKKNNIHKNKHFYTFFPFSLKPFISCFFSGFF